MWLRCRFEANFEDPRPVEFPPPGPYWITGYAGDESFATVVAYVRNQDQVFDYWPEAENLTTQKREEITYTDRFSKPDWFDDVEQKEK